MKNDFGYTAFTNDNRNSTNRPSLFESFANVLENTPTKPALIARDSNSKRKSLRYLSLSFTHLNQEIEAWKTKLREIGISHQDRVLIWMPQSLPMLAAGYAALELSTEVAVCETTSPSIQAIRTFNPSIVIASSSVVRQSKKLFGDGVFHLEIRNPKLRLAGQVIVYSQSTKTNLGRKYGLTVFREDKNGHTQAVRFNEANLAAIIESQSKFLETHELDTTYPEDALSLFLNSAHGFCSAIPNTEFAPSLSKNATHLVSAIQDLEINQLSLRLDEWIEILNYCTKNRIQCKSLNIAFLNTKSTPDPILLEQIRKIFPKAKTYSVFETVTTPIVSITTTDRLPNTQFNELNATYLGELLPGLRKRVELPKNSEKPRFDQPQSSRVGELHIFGESTGRILQDESSVTEQNHEAQFATGLFSIDDGSNSIWVCGSEKQAVQTSFGVFIPARCEAVFSRHPKVERCTLFNLGKKETARPGILIETKPTGLPRNALAESKFKAELLQLGAGQDDTKLILDFFFCESATERESVNSLPNRKSLSLRYTILSRLKAAF